jgi:hypothetical protein
MRCVRSDLVPYFYWRPPPFCRATILRGGHFSLSYGAPHSITTCGAHTEVRALPPVLALATWRWRSRRRGLRGGFDYGYDVVGTDRPVDLLIARGAGPGLRVLPGTRTLGRWVNRARGEAGSGAALAPRATMPPVRERMRGGPGTMRRFAVCFVACSRRGGCLPPDWVRFSRPSTVSSFMMAHLHNAAPATSIALPLIQRPAG